MIRTERSDTIATSKTMTAPTMAAMAAGISDLPWIHEGGNALDVHDVHRRSRRDYLGVVIGTRGPLLAADPDPATAPGDFLEHIGGPADQGGGAGPEQRRLPDVAQGERAGNAKAQGRGEHECAELYRRATAGGARAGSHDGGQGDQPERQGRRDDLNGAEDSRDDYPDNPGLHVALLLVTVYLEAIPSRFSSQ